MPTVLNGDGVPKKRKPGQSNHGLKASKRKVYSAEESSISKADIERLENEVDQSRQHYNNIATLISMIDVEHPADGVSLTSTISLCRVFARLITAGRLSAELHNRESNERVITAWLKQRYEQYQSLLLRLLQCPHSGVQSTVMVLVMRLVEQETHHLKKRTLNTWTSGLFAKVLAVLIGGQNVEQLRGQFISTYLLQYDDIRFYTFTNVAEYASQERSSEALDNAITLMTAIINVPSSVEKLLVETFPKEKDPVRSITAHRRKAQDAWLALLRTELSVSQRKNLLRVMSHIIAPWFLKPELLMDFLTDSYNVGGASSLLALSGLFYLIQERNLDYSQFYPKLYSLLDEDLLHSKHRSRFFRLLNTFMSSTHLPAALVASFIKRLSRLALNAPPAAVVAIVPWIYNLLKAHPACTFMIHRVIMDQGYEAQLDAEGMDDPFDMSESDPMLTDAMESSLWELETLQSHYHPNVASLAKIISEQFTKQAYNIDDFLDHSYKSMLDAELGKDLKKVPVVEFQIPKRIFTDRGIEEDGGKDDSLLRRLWQF